MVLFDIYGSFGVKVLVDIYIGWEIIENLDFQDFFFREKMKILRHITCTLYLIDHNTHGYKHT